MKDSTPQGGAGQEYISFFNGDCQLPLIWDEKAWVPSTQEYIARATLNFDTLREALKDAYGSLKAMRGVINSLKHHEDYDFPRYATESIEKAEEALRHSEPGT